MEDLNTTIQELLKRVSTLEGQMANHKHRGFDFSKVIPTLSGLGNVTLDTDGTLTANSDSKIASQKATKTYADTKIAKSIGTTKGDIIGFSGSSTPVRVAVGTDGKFLKADSGDSSGVSWATPSFTLGVDSVYLGFNVGSDDTDYAQNVSGLSFTPKVFIGVCEGGSSAGGTTGQSSFFVACPDTASSFYALTSKGTAGNLGTHGGYNSAYLGFATDSGGEGNFTVDTWVSDGFTVHLNRVSGNNSGGTVAGVIIGY